MTNDQFALAAWIPDPERPLAAGLPVEDDIEVYKNDLAAGQIIFIYVHVIPDRKVKAQA